MEFWLVASVVLNIIFVIILIQKPAGSKTEESDEFPTVTSGRIKELRTMPYDQYLETDEWRTRRKIMLRLFDYRCQTCNRLRMRGYPLHVHHRNYVRLGNEKPIDLTVLCSVCHELIHKHRGNPVSE